MALARRGADRQAVHEIIREHAMAAWAVVQAGGANPLIGALCADARLSHYATAEEMRGWLDASGYVGDAPDRARHLAALLRRSGG